MTIFVSDTHFGRSPGRLDDQSERDLVACLRMCGPDLEAVYLVGDIFEHYIEYRHVVPKGFIRFQSALLELTDLGVPVYYLVGNHDPWHRDYFEAELGVKVILDHSVEPLYGLNVYVTHGDGLGPEGGVYARLKPILRHPIPVSLYKWFLPADAGMGIAKWYSRSFRSETINEARTGSLRAAARELLERDGYDLVIMGHSHVPEMLKTEHGTYMNCGCWYADRTVGIVDENGPALKQWRSTALFGYHP